MLRIAILGCRGYPSTYGGFETLVRHLVPFLTREGHEVTVYCRDPGLSFKWNSSRLGQIRRVYTPGLDKKAFSTLSFGATATLDLMARDVDAALVLNVANGFFLPLLTRRIPRVVVNVDGIEWERNKWSSLGKKVFRRGAELTAKYAHEIIVDSCAIGVIWKDAFGRDGNFIPYGADLVYERPLGRIESLGLTRRSYGLVVARLAPENNIDLILDSIELLPDLRFVVVGSANFDNPITSRLRRLSDERANFMWLGHVDDQELLTDLWFHAKVYVHGHSVGGTNPALLQALGCGTPTLALDTKFNREVLEFESMLFPHDAKRLAVLVAEQFATQFHAPDIRSIVERRYRWSDCCESYASILT